MSRARHLARAVLPQPVRYAAHRRVHALREYRELPRRLERLETLLLESQEMLHERSQRRWTQAAPDVELTFGRSLTGDAFVAKAAEYGAFGEGRTIVEIGPGYGRLADAAQRAGVEFGRWIGVDLSRNNVDHLRGRFGFDARFEFVNADAESVELSGEADTLISSLTLKHFHPSFEVALANIAGRMDAGGTIVIDLIEGDRRYFEDDAETYIRWYRRDEVESIFERCGCEVTAFDAVQHDPDHRRLLVVGRLSA
jgi:SAM-dependent methyltransferase